MAKQFYVYILASKPNGTLYTGVTSNLIQRVWQHNYEVHENAESALTREKKIKRWRRAWKLGLIENSNPEWRDLYENILG
jgi:putative endonuclease